jgi:hypothetical protein
MYGVDASAHDLRYRVDRERRAKVKGIRTLHWLIIDATNGHVGVIEHGVPSVSGSPSRQCTCALRLE